MGETTTAAGLDPLLVELLRIRTSQINGCVFCLRMHTGDALKKGESRPDRRASGSRSEGRCCGLGIRSGGLPQYLQWF
ncbi:carboxymuconolactone decarboxylase family protein [Streptomyces sp. NBC_00271]|uniref:carboxymuconolactone decarboxylase family protein n=1 Tax=Streptomyces sp. NBC_00271 TaxID=2975697 RepID=UPI002E27D7CE|nr:carboxymuconolactone decarboxylase family protein [Streptomyces sp. NBC_00271]